MFAWNGGPGSASMWLHMGVLGPQRTVVEDLQINGKGPFRRVDNEFSIIDVTDLVMVDPVGTDLAGVVVEDRHAGLDPGADDDRVVIEGAIDRLDEDIVVEKGQGLKRRVAARTLDRALLAARCVERG